MKLLLRGLASILKFEIKTIKTSVFKKRRFRKTYESN